MGVEIFVTVTLMFILLYLLIILHTLGRADINIKVTIDKRLDIYYRATYRLRRLVLIKDNNASFITRDPSITGDVLRLPPHTTVDTLIDYLKLSKGPNDKNLQFLYYVLTQRRNFNQIESHENQRDNRKEIFSVLNRLSDSVQQFLSV